MSTTQQRSNYVVVSTPHTREAKKVIDYKVYNGKQYYKVKWESSWESEESLTEYQDLVDQFWQFVKRVSSEEKDEQGRKRPRLSDEDVQDDNDTSIGNSEDDIPIKGTITLSDGVKLQESGNFYRLTQDKDESEQDDGTIFIVQGNQPTHIIKNRTHKGNVHVIGIQHEPKPVATVKKPIRASDENLLKTDDDRKFPCQVCGMTFRRNDIKRRHEITHSKEYRYFCAICGKGFIRRYVLVKHLARDHNSTDSGKIVYQKNKKKADEAEPSMLADLHQEDSTGDIEMKSAQQVAPQEHPPYPQLVEHAVDQMVSRDDVVQIEAMVDPEATDLVDKDPVSNQHIVDGDGCPPEEVEDTSNLHVTAILAAQLAAASATAGKDDKEIRVKDEGTQIT